MIPVLALFLLAASPVTAGPLGAAIGGLLATAAGTTTVGAILGRIVLSVAISAYQKRKMKKALAAQQSGIRSQFTAAGGVNPLSFIVGRYATNGYLVAPPMSQPAASNPPNAYLTYVMDLGDIPGATVTRVAIDDQWAAVSEEVTEGQADLGPTFEAPFNNLAWMRVYDGTQTVADPFLLAKFGADPERPWSADMIGRGIPYVVLTFLRNAERFPGEPRRRLEVMGIPLYDPRRDSTVGGSGPQRWADRSTWTQTDNPKVIHYNILRGIEVPGFGVWGARAAADELPLANWFAAMNECDLPVDDGKGGTEPQFRFGFEILVSDKPGMICDEIDRSCGGKTVEIGGVYKTRVGGVGLPVYFFTDVDILVTRPQEMEPFPGLEDSANALSASYPDPDILWETREAPAYLNAEWEAEDASTEWDANAGQWVRQPRRLMQDVSLPGVVSASQVQRLLAAMAKDGRRWRNHGLTLPPEACALEPLDAVAWTSQRNGYNAKVFEIVLTADPVEELRPRLGIVETDPSDYDFDPEGYLPSVAPSILPVSAGLVTVPGFSAVPHVLKDASGVDRRPAILCVWTGALVGEARGLALELRLAASQAMVWTGSTGDLLTGQVILSDVLPLTSYEVRAKVLSESRPAPWTPWVPVTTLDLRLAEGDLANSVQEALTEAMAVRDAAYARAAEVLADANQAVADLRTAAEGAIGDVLEQVDTTLLGRLSALDADVVLSMPRRIDTDETLDLLSERLGWLTLQLAQTQTNMADAGIYIDPALGRARIEGVARVDGAISNVVLLLDALQSEISLRATYADVINLVTEAQLDPESLPVISDLQGRISDAEISLSGMDGRIDLKADTIILDGVSARVTAAEVEIDTLNDQIALRVTTTDFSDLETRVGEAEITLGTLDAPSLTLAVSDARAATEAGDDLSSLTLQELLGRLRDRDLVQADIAYARQDMRALVDEDRSAIATLRTDLGAAVATSTALIVAEREARATALDAAAADRLTLRADVGYAAAGLVEEAQVRADQTGALAERATDLEVRLDHPTTGLAANAAATGLLTTRVSTAEGLIDSQAASITALSTGVSAKGRVIFQSAAPAVADRLPQNLWIDTTGGANTPKRWTGSAWAAVSDKAATDALAALASKADASALSALTTRVSDTEGSIASQAASITTLSSSLETKGRVIFQSAAPAVGDRLPQNLWIDTTGGANTPKRWNGSAWVAVTDKVAADALAALASKADASALSALTTRVGNTEGNVSSLVANVLALESTIGDAFNLVAGAELSRPALWTLPAGWSVVSPVVVTGITSIGVLRFAKPAGTGWGEPSRSSPFAVIAGDSYGVRFQAMGSAGTWTVQARLFWYDAMGAYVAATDLPSLSGSGATVGARSAEAIAPAGARTARLLFRVALTGTAALIDVGGPVVERVTGAMASSRAAIDTLDAALTTPTTGLVARLSGLEAEVRDPASGLAPVKATVDAQQTVLATLEGRAEATYTLRIKAGGAAAGFEIVAADDPISGPASVIRLGADQFIVNGDTFLEDAFIAKLIARQALVSDLRVDTLMIKGNAVTIPVYADFPGQIRPVASPGAQIAVASIDREGFATVISFGCQMGGAGYAEVLFRIFRNNHVIREIAAGTGPNGASQSVFTQVVDRNTGTGPTTYRVDAIWQAYAQAFITQRSLSLVQTKR